MVPLHRGVYAEVRRAGDPWCRRAAALLAVGSRAALCGPTAAAVHGLPVEGLRRDEQVHVAAGPPGHPRPRPGITLHLPARWPQTVVRDGLPVTTLERTVLDLSAGRSSEAVLGLLAHVLQQRRTTPARVRAALVAAGPITGSRAARRALSELADGQESVLEAHFARLVRRSRLPEPEWQVPVVAGGRRRRLDAFWRPARLALELDGRAFHLDPQAWEDGLLRDADLLGVGIEVVHLTWRQLRHDPDGVVARLDAALRRRWPADLRWPA
ncbi:MAG: hypothetical protein M3Z02_08635 [Actinomycetota bacterium]|nr:hypothetical protein [Actinomycetota bacterium]